MIKIERISNQLVKIGDAEFPTGQVGIVQTNSGNNIKLVLLNGSFSPKICEEKFSTYANAAGVKYTTFAAASAAIAAAIAPGDGLSSALSDKNTVAQATSTTTAVTLNNLNGIISTWAQTAAADTQVTFTVNNSKVVATSNVIPSVIYPAANTGSPVVRIGAIAAGSFTVVITNAGTAVLNGANGTLKIGFIVL